MDAEHPHATPQFLEKQLLRYEDQVRLDPSSDNQSTVFQSQLTETSDDILQCVLSGPRHCFGHLVGIMPNPALEYWQFETLNTSAIVTDWFRRHRWIEGEVGTPNRAINVVLVDYYRDYYTELFRLATEKNTALANTSRLGEDPLSPADWMGELGRHTNHTLRVSEMTLLGTHDAATYIIRSRGVQSISPKAYCPSNLDTALCRLGLELTRPMIESFATTQKANLYEQLMMGIRYLDLRVVPILNTTGDWITSASSSEIGLGLSHGGVLLQLGLHEAFQQIVSFLDEHPREVILVLLSHPEGDGVYTGNQLASWQPWRVLQRIARGYLGDWVIPNCVENATRLPSLQEVWVARGLSPRGGVFLLTSSAYLSVPTMTWFSL